VPGELVSETGWCAGNADARAMPQGTAGFIHALTRRFTR
jgi:hypothetical protein